MNTPQNITVKSLVIGDVSKRSLGLDTVDNTSDLDKPISTAQQIAIDLKADQLTTYTKVASDSLLDLKSDQATTYTKTEVDTNIANLVAAAPQTLDTLNELAAALGNDENFATTVTAAIATNAANIVTANENIGYTGLEVDVNTGDIATNTADIVAANAAIEANTAAIEDNSDAIATNTFNVNANQLNLQLWTSNNATAIANETARATTAEGVNATAIALNTAKVGITPTQASEINTALQPTDPTLQSVTNNGSTTGNDIAVGGRITTGNNSATGGNAIALGGTNNFATGAGSEVLGGDDSTASGTGSTVIGGSGQTVSGNWSISLGGLNGDISGSRGTIIGGSNNTLTHNDSAMIATLNQSSVANNTTHVYNLHAFGGITMPTGATDSYVLTSDASGVGTWQANEKVSSDTTGEAAGSDSVLNMVSLTQAEYDTALANFPATIKATTLYIIKP